MSHAWVGVVAARSSAKAQCCVAARSSDAAQLYEAEALVNSKLQAVCQHSEATINELRSQLADAEERLKHAAEQALSEIDILLRLVAPRKG